MCVWGGGGGGFSPASFMGLFPWLSMALKSAPMSRRRSTTSTWPSHAATCRQVRPSWLAALTLMPLSRMAAMRATSPRLANLMAFSTAAVCRRLLRTEMVCFRVPPISSSIVSWTDLADLPEAPDLAEPARFQALL